jgi:hypothetical protein
MPVKRFKKKPVEIEAIQWPGYSTPEIEEFVGQYLVSEESNVHTVGHFIVTLEGNSYLLSKDDWIIKGIKGEFYPCKPDIF